MGSGFYSPLEITEYVVETGYKKSMLPAMKMLLLGIIAGIFLSLAGHGTEVLVHGTKDLGQARLLSAIVFPVGLMMILMAGGELFTGNCLIIVSCLERKAKWLYYLKSLFFVYFGNLIGSLIVVYSLSWLNQVNHSDGMYGAYAIKVAAYKSNLTFSTALVSGIFANLLVCIGVWMCYAAKDIAGKVLGTFFPIYLFIILGLEHVIANMYYIPMGLMAKSNPEYVEHAKTFFNVSQEKIDNLTLSNAIVNNFIPATIGNFIGGAVMVGLLYWIVYLKKSKHGK